ncbi:MAG: hydroxyacylglutathione hydrolase [Myxococcota bacterium]
MLVEQIWTGNALRNFNYLIACEQTGEALVVDPYNAEQCLERAAQKGWTVTQILNTHEHPDHIAGNRGVRQATGAPTLAHFKAKIRDVDHGLRAGDAVRVGKTVELECLDTPGHTMTHLCLRSHSDEPALFCGDTLFNAGAGNCYNGGNPESLYTSFAEQIAELPNTIRVFPGHELIANNLRFTLDREPDNDRARALLEEVKDQDPNQALVTTMALEREVNTFLRLESPTLIARLREAHPELPTEPDSKTVFITLRELRDRW